MKYIILAFLNLCLIVSSFFLIDKYPSLMGQFVLLNIVTSIFLLSNFIGRFSLFYFFLSIMLFFGYHVKLIRFLLFDGDLTEPTGKFVNHISDYSELINIISLGVISLTLGRLVQVFVINGFLNERVQDRLPVWFSKYQFFVITALVSISLSVFSLMIINNAAIGTTLALPWPLPMVISFLGSFGITIITFKLIGYKLLLREKIWKLSVFLFLVAITSSIVLVSRSAFVFILLPLFFILVEDKIIKSSTIIKLVSITLFILLYILGIVSIARENFFDLSAVDFVDFSSVLIAGVDQLIYLLISRFVGLEGIMVFIGNGSNSLELFTSLLSEKITPGSYTLYSHVTGELSYLNYDRESFLYYPFPGFMGFILSVGSFTLFPLIVLILFLCFVIFEVAYINIVKNRFIICYLSLSYAMLFMQFAVVPTQLLKNSILLMIFLLMYNFIEKLAINKKVYK